VQGIRRVALPIRTRRSSVAVEVPVHVQLWFDPVCPFCWMTSRWLVRVAAQRELTIEWLPISLLLKNASQPGDRFHDEVVVSHGLLRVVEAVREAGHGDRIGDLYTAFGREIHVTGDEVDVSSVLAGLGLDTAFARAVDDERYDAAIRRAMDDGLALVGDQVGTPIIAVERPGGSGERVGLFGPVITRLPDPEASLRLWDGFLAMVATDGFFELKRTRDAAPERLTEDDLHG
jgi:2-hydroxychromene-2-carboxylate isomerase